jgi:hypothetical protein
MLLFLRSLVLAALIAVFGCFNIGVGTALGKSVMAWLAVMFSVKLNVLIVCGEPSGLLRRICLDSVFTTGAPLFPAVGTTT